MNSKVKKKILQVFSLVVCLLMLLSICVLQKNKIWGHSLNFETEEQSSTQKSEKSGLQTINTTILGKDIIGYGGTVPLEITVKNDVIFQIKALNNQETPEFFEKASTLFKKWQGKTVEEALNMEVDAVSGATFSSKAIIGNMQRGLRFLTKSQSTTHQSIDRVSWKSVAAFLVVLLAATLPFLIKSHWYQIIQMILNVIVLGFLCGQFLSYTSITNVLGNGIQGWTALTSLVMLVTAFVYPLLGKKSYYCSHVCPLGAMQQLTNMCTKRKIRLSPTTIHRLDIFRQVLWSILMILLWSGAWASWVDYELFTAFILQSAPWPIIIVAILFTILSLFIQRPYCRFVCPTGTLFKFSQSSK